MVWLISFEVTVCEMLMVEILKKLLSQQKIPKHCISEGWHLAHGTRESNNPYYFLKELIKIFKTHLNILQKL